MTRLGKVLLATVLLSIFSAPQASKADTIQWEGITWNHVGSAGPYVDGNNNLVVTGSGYHDFQNNTQTWGDWFQLTFFDPGQGSSNAGLEIYDGPINNNSSRAHIYTYLGLDYYRIGMLDDEEYSGRDIPRSAGIHTFRIVNTASHVQFWLDNQVFDTLLHLDRILQEYTYETVVGPLESVQAVVLWGSNSILMDFQSGTGLPPQTSEIPEPGTLLMFGSAATLLCTLRQRRLRCKINRPA